MKLTGLSLIVFYVKINKGNNILYTPNIENEPKRCKGVFELM